MADQLQESFHFRPDTLKYNRRFPNGCNLLPEQRPGFAYDLYCIFNMAADLLCYSGDGLDGLIGLVRQAPDLIGNNNKPFTCRPCTDRFN
ncbi:hypothetical protein D3C80_1764950 [compost metagenome]